MKRHMRIIYLLCGFIALGLATLGVILPLLPTTPFLLLAVFCFARSSEKLHAYVLNHQVFGQYLRDYQNHEMTTGNKTFTIILMWSGMFLSAWLAKFNLAAVITLFVIGTGVTIHLLSLRKPRRRRWQNRQKYSHSGSE
ncbi:YbaN family protein [Arcanobacterium hippocoleae]|uniref:YbaN family protein n=1 Tax=Arcanobacterium hippocoleae TaxID=149017 RepID=UPI003341AC6F